MSKKIRIFLISFFTTLGIFLFDPDFLDLVLDLIQFIMEKAESVKNTIGWAATILSLVMYIKLRFYDTRMFNKIQKAYGKQQFLDALVIVLNMLEVMNPEQVLNKIFMTNKTEVDMQKAMRDLQKLLTPETIQEKCVEIKLDRKETKVLSDKIKVLMDLIDKRLEMHYISKDVFKNKPTDLSESIQKSITSKKKREKYDKYLEKTGKKHILTNLSK